MKNFQNPQNHKYHSEDRRNLIIFMITVFALFALYDVFIKQPYIDTMKEEQAQKAATQQATSITPQTEQATQRPLTRAEAIAQTGERLRIQTPELSGSIALKGGRIDDLILTQYYQTMEEQDKVILLSPTTAPEPHYGEFGWIAERSGVTLPSRMTQWQIKDGSPKILTPEAPVTLVWDNGEGLTFEREISVDDHYMFRMTQRVINASNNDITLYPYGLVARHGQPEVQKKSFILHEGPIGYFKDSLQEHTFKDLTEKPERTSLAQGGWIGFTQKYWFAGLIPDQSVQSKFRFLARPGESRNFYQTDVMGPAMTIPAGQEKAYESHFFAGAKKVRQLDAYEKQLDIPHFDLVVDFGMLYFMTKPFFYILTWLSSTIGSFAIGLLLFTVLVRLLVFPLANKSYRSFAKMRIIAPKMKELQDRYKDDREGMQKALFELYKKEQVNPAAGCLPLLLQIPIFFALYKVLYVTIEMRHTPFFGWIQDMSAPDPTSLFNLFGVLPYEPISFLMIGAWPCIMCVTLLLQQQLSPPPTEPMQKQIMLMMPFVMTYILASFPAGLVIYWTWSNFLSIIQQIVLMKMMGADIHLFRFFTGKKKAVQMDDEATQDFIEEHAEDVTDVEETQAKPVTAPKRRRKKKK